MNKSLPPAQTSAALAVATNAVEVRGLRVQRGKTDVFDGLDLDIPRGQITGLLGPSGCGKTTLMRSIVGVQKVDGGTVTVLGAPAGSPRSATASRTTRRRRRCTAT